MHPGSAKLYNPRGAQRDVGRPLSSRVQLPPLLFAIHKCLRRRRANRRLKAPIWSSSASRYHCCGRSSLASDASSVSVSYCAQVSSLWLPRSFAASYLSEISKVSTQAQSGPFGKRYAKPNPPERYLIADIELHISLSESSPSTPPAFDRYSPNNAGSNRARATTAVAATTMKMAIA